jgi:hypothetical protein
MCALCVVSKDKRAKYKTVKTKKQVRMKYKQYKSIQKKILLGGGDILHPSRLALAPSQPPIQLLPGNFGG